MKNTCKYGLLLAVSGGLAEFAFFNYAFPYHLLHKEQQLLFTYTAGQLGSYWGKPAALSCLAGDFITQFFHYRETGAALTALLMIVLGMLVYRVCRKWTGKWVAILPALFITAWETLRFSDVAYPIAGTISLIGGLALFLLADKLRGKWGFAAAGIVGTVVAYVLLGYGIFAFALPALLTSLTRKRKYTAAILIAATTITVPYLSSVPYRMTPLQSYTYPATTGWNLPDKLNERLLGLNTEDYYENWDKVRLLTYPVLHTNMLSVSYNLANAMQGKLPDKLLDYYQPAGLGLFMPVNEESNYLSTQLAGEVWFRLGDMTMAEHATILSMIFSPQHKGVRAVQRLAEINLVNGDETAARKYLYLLSRTFYYKQWAEERMPGRESEAVKKWLVEKRALLPLKDTVRTSTTDIAKSLHLLLDANPDNRMARDYLLCFHLLMKDLPAFAEDYRKYHSGKPGRLYAEALLIQLYKEQATGNEIKSTGMSPDVVKEFKEYNRLRTQSNGNPDALSGRFGKSYWFYYQFAQFQ